MKIRLFFILLFFLAIAGCATEQKIASTRQPLESDQGTHFFYSIKEAMDRDKDIIDYDTLLWIHQAMAQNQPYIPRLEELLSSLIMKRNENPRIDNMILILAARIIGSSQIAIDDVYGLFESMLKMDHRLNSWVIAHIAGAIYKYPYDITEGDHLVDLLEKKAAPHLVDGEPPKEYFGHHFMPPPKGKYIPKYIDGIENQQVRVFERNCYYNLIHNQWTEGQIEKALKQLQTQGIPETGKKTTRPLKYIVQHPTHFLY